MKVNLVVKVRGIIPWGRLDLMCQKQKVWDWSFKFYFLQIVVELADLLLWATPTMSHTPLSVNFCIFLMSGFLEAQV